MIRKVYNFWLFAFITHYEKNLVAAKTLVKNVTLVPIIVLSLWENTLQFVR